MTGSKQPDAGGILPPGGSPAVNGETMTVVRVDRPPAAVRGEPGPSPARRARPGALELILIGLAVLAVAWFYTWSAWAASAFEDWGESDYYRLLVRGFRQGHLHLDHAPRPELLALADPYDPAQNAPYRLGDASYYKGHYYLYFGAGPAVSLMLPFALVTGREMTTGVAVYIFCLVAFGTMTALWLVVRSRYFPRSAAWIGAAGVLGLGSSTHLLTLLRRPMWWELAIAAGIAFTLLALAAVYRAMHGPRPRFALAIAGLCLGLAVASRPVFLLAAPMLLPPLWWAWREHRRAAGGRARAGRGSWWQLALAAAVPLGACGLALMVYNHARFENPFEFGQSYQLSGAYESKLRHFSLAYLPHNAWALFLQPLHWTWEFPFAMAWADPADVPGYMGSEEIAGLVWTFPFVVLALLVPLGWRGRMDPHARSLPLFAAAIAGYLVPVCLLILCHFSTTARYTADFATGLALLAAIGLLGIEHRAQSWSSLCRALGWRIIVAPAVVTAVAVSALLAVLLSFDYHSRAPMREDPPRWDWHERAWSEVIGKVGLALGWYSGPVMMPVTFSPRPPGTVETLWRSADRDTDERVMVEHADWLKLRLGYARAGSPTHWSEPVPWTAGHVHRVEIQLPTLHGPANRWYDGFRRRERFRERSAVALWFDHERVLAAIVPPPRPGMPEGGEVPADFRGHAGPLTRRLLRADELPASPAAWMVAGPPPSAEQPTVPLLTTGRADAANVLSLAWIRPQVGRLVFRQSGRPPVASPEFALPSGDRLTVEIEQPPLWPWSATEDEQQPLAIWIDGRLVWETRVRWHASAPEEVFLAGNPFGRGEREAEAPGWSRSDSRPRVRGGPLRLRVVFPVPVSEDGEPLLAVGALYQSDTVGVRRAGAVNEARVFFEHFGSPVENGGTFTFTPGAADTVQIGFPSFDPKQFGRPAAGEIAVRINGQPILTVAGVSHPLEEIFWHVGRNRYGGSLCGPHFRGWVLDWRWMGAAEPAVSGGR